MIYFILKEKRTKWFKTRNLSLTKHEKTAKSAIIAKNAILGMCFWRKQAWDRAWRSRALADRDPAMFEFSQLCLFTIEV